MEILELIRIESSTSGVIGVIRLNKQAICFSLEPRRLNNEKNMACINIGTYLCKRYVSEKYRDSDGLSRGCIALYNVPGRGYISIHPGNTVKDTKGCILPGLSIGSVSGRRAVLDSNKALDKILVQSGDNFLLTITENY